MSLTCRGVTFLFFTHVTDTKWALAQSNCTSKSHPRQALMELNCQAGKSNSDNFFSSWKTTQTSV